MNIRKTVEFIQANTFCKVYPPAGIPVISEQHCLPEDLATFYSICGGVDLYLGEPFGVQILPPDQLLLANPIIVGELCAEDISSEWYTIGKFLDSSYITIDLSASRLGRCYDSFWDRHGLVGECKVVSPTFSSLLVSLYESQGKSIFWLDPNFVSLGDAYDE